MLFFLETMYKMKGLGLRIKLEEKPCYRSGSFFQWNLEEGYGRQEKELTFDDALLMGPHASSAHSANYSCSINVCKEGRLMRNGKKRKEKELTGCAFM